MRPIYRWTQWIFELLYKRGLAYRKLAAVNWDPVDKTVLADEEIVGGRAERSGALVEKRYIPQWFFKITDYAQRLIDDLDDIDWPEGIKSQQRNWIGRSEGVQFTMKVRHAKEHAEQALAELSELEPVGQTRDELAFEVFTTRVDTIFGMTFCVLGARASTSGCEFSSGVDASHVETAAKEYQSRRTGLSDTDRLATTREKTGVFTGAYATNPANGEAVPIWVADYVLATYGTGAIMAVPGHDERDFEFASEFGIDDPASHRAELDVGHRPAVSWPKTACSSIPASTRTCALPRPVVDRQMDGGARGRRAQDSIQAARLADLPPALLGMPDSGHPQRG